VYVSQLTLYITDDHLFCKVFPTSLKGTALSSFIRLPPVNRFFRNLENKVYSTICNQQTPSPDGHCVDEYLTRKRRIPTSIYEQVWQRRLEHSWAYPKSGYATFDYRSSTTTLHGQFGHATGRRYGRPLLEICIVYGCGRTQGVQESSQGRAEPRKAEQLRL